MSVSWDKRELERVAASQETTDALLDYGHAVARDAAAGAPRDTGRGADSIHAEVVEVNGVPEVRVSWDEEHFYMAFSELGTSDQRARPFLRPAALRYQ